MRKLTGRTGFLLGAGENLRLLVWSWRKFEALGQELRENILSCLSKGIDTVSSATCSSKAIIEACQKALEQAKN